MAAPTPAPAPAPAPAAAASAVYVGFFYNTSIQTGGTAAGVLTPSATRITGSWDFTQDDAETTVLCGASESIDLPRSGTAFNGTFTSNDTDSGCGFDHNAIVTLAGTIDGGDTHLSGTYSAVNSGGSTIVGGSGVFDVWKDGPQTIQACRGTATVPGSGSRATAMLDAGFAIYVGDRVLWGLTETQNYDTVTGAPIANCVTEATVVGRRTPGSNAIEFKWMATGRAGSGCTSSTASGSLQLAGSYTGTALSAADVPAAEVTYTLTCTPQAVTPSGADAPALVRALRSGLRARAD